jgi:hypothetical protein
VSGGPDLREPHRPLDLEVAVDAALRAVEDAAEVWGAEWRREGTGGRLALPVTAGIRHGLIEGEVRAERHGDSSRLFFDAERTAYRVHFAALVVLILGAGGALFTVVAPLVPPMLELLPMAGLLALLAWFLVVARIRNRNVADFFALVEMMVEKMAEDGRCEESDEASGPRQRG